MKLSDEKQIVMSIYHEKKSQQKIERSSENISKQIWEQKVNYEHINSWMFFVFCWPLRSEIAQHDENSFGKCESIQLCFPWGWLFWCSTISFPMVVGFMTTDLSSWASTWSLCCSCECSEGCCMKFITFRLLSLFCEKKRNLWRL